MTLFSFLSYFLIRMPIVSCLQSHIILYVIENYKKPFWESFIMCGVYSPSKDTRTCKEVCIHSCMPGAADSTTLGKWAHTTHSDPQVVGWIWTARCEISYHFHFLLTSISWYKTHTFTYVRSCFPLFDMASMQFFNSGHSFI